MQVLFDMLLCVLFLLSVTVTAYSQNDIWHVSNASVSVHNDEVVLSAEEMIYAGMVFSQIKYHCDDSITLYPKHKCHDALVDLMFGGKNYRVKLDSAFDFEDKFWSIGMSSIDQNVSVLADSTKPTAQVVLQAFEIGDLMNASKVLAEPLSGLFSGEMILDVNALKLSSSNVITFSDVMYEHSDDVVFFGLEGHIEFKVDVIKQQFNASLLINGGEMLFDQLYIDYTQFPVELELSAALNQDSGYNIDVNIINKQSMFMQADVVVNQQFEWLIPDATIKVTDSHHFNQQILNSILGIYGFGGTQMSGAYTINIKTINNKINHLQLGFDDFYALNEKRKAQVDSLSGDVYWNFNSNSQDSHLQWQSLLFAGMPVDGTTVDFNLTQDEFNLLGKHIFPVFDGSIIVKEFQADSLFSESIGMELNAAVLPISLKLITEKLNWPIMSGTISGELPGMVKKGNVITFLGVLRMTVFEGDMLIENLSLERLFGVAPVIAADVKFNGFDLSLLTETFGFGQITGKLAGEVKQLRITNWKTDRLDAHVYTVKTKGIKQTISQRAIDNISSLGGIKGAISKTFLRFFDDFKYKKIALSCKLHNAVCQIGGLKNQENQFVIVEGGGIPKINIVGFVRTINWEEFISRLLNANYDN